MSAKEYKVIKENWDQFVNEEEQINEVSIVPGVAWLLRSYQWLAPMFSILSQRKEVPVAVRPYLKTIASALTNFKQTMEKLEKTHKTAYYIIMTPIIAADVGGAAAGKAKEVVLKQILAKMQEEASAKEQPDTAGARELG